MYSLSIGCGQDVLDVLVELKAKVDINLNLLGKLLRLHLEFEIICTNDHFADGHNSPAVPCQNIIADVKAAVDVIVAIKVDTVITAHVSAIVEILVYIIHGVALCLAKYGLLVVLKFCIQIDLCLSALVGAVLQLIPSVLVGLKAG